MCWSESTELFIGLRHLRFTYRAAPVTDDVAHCSPTSGDVTGHAVETNAVTLKT